MNKSNPRVVILMSIVASGCFGRLQFPFTTGVNESGVVRVGAAGVFEGGPPLSGNGSGWTLGPLWRFEADVNGPSSGTRAGTRNLIAIQGRYYFLRMVGDRQTGTYYYRDASNVMRGMPAASDVDVLAVGLSAYGGYAPPSGGLAGAVALARFSIWYLYAEGQVGGEYSAAHDLEFVARLDAGLVFSLTQH